MNFSLKQLRPTFLEIKREFENDMPMFVLGEFIPVYAVTKKISCNLFLENDDLVKPQFVGKVFFEYSMGLSCVIFWFESEALLPKTIKGLELAMESIIKNTYFGDAPKEETESYYEPI